MKQIEFKLGDVVRLKSGSPKLTVTSIDTTLPSNPHISAKGWSPGASEWVHFSGPSTTFYKVGLLDRLFG